MKKTPEKFYDWIEKKIEIEFWNYQDNDVIIWEFWRYYEGMNIWNEISKDEEFKRASIILNNNLWNDLVLIAPLTTKYHISQKDYYVEISNYKKYWIRPWNAVLNQIKLIDKRRLKGKMTNERASIKFVNYILNKAIWLVFWIKNSPTFQ